MRRSRLEEIPPSGFFHCYNGPDPSHSFYAEGCHGEVSQVLFRLSRWENLEYAKKI